MRSRVLSRGRFFNAGAGPCAAVALGATLFGQAPTFRSSVDVIAVDVQVVDRTGQPIDALESTDFSVTVGGRRARVLSANFVRHSDPKPLASATQQTAANFWPAAETPSATTPGRTIVLAIDEASFDAASLTKPLQVARAFLAALEPNDAVGLHVYPFGARIAPTTNRSQLVTEFPSVAGHRASFTSQYNLGSSEIVDLQAELVRSNPFTSPIAVTAAERAANTDLTALTRVQARECPTDTNCPSRILAEAGALAAQYEMQAELSLGGLRDLIASLAARPGRKIVVLLSAGALVSDRPGGRPTVGDLGRVMGQEAAQANVAVYTLHIWPDEQSTYTSTRRRLSAPDTQARDMQLLGRWLDDFSDAAGGLLIPVPTGSGLDAFNRVLRETSAHYLLAVEPDARSRDGRLQTLKVAVDRRNAEIRSRQWVAVPRPGP